MTVLHCTKRISGGAGVASYRLHQSLVAGGTDSRLLVEYDTTDDNTVYGSNSVLGHAVNFMRSRLNSLPLVRYRNRSSVAFTPVWVPERQATHITEHNPDIIQLHWVGDSFVQPQTIADLDAPVIWTLHDMWPFTGGCHYSDGCEKYRHNCGACPELGSQVDSDLSRQTWQHKNEAWKDLELTVVSPSKWLAQCARDSRLFEDFRIEVIPNGIDTDQFRPQRRQKGINRFGWDANKKYILFGANYSTKRKGGDLFIQALKRLSDSDSIAVVTFGNTDIDSAEIPLPVIDLGYLSESELRLAYSTADVTAVPSRQDNLPNIAIESLACGTPCVAFEIGGLPEILQHKKTGYLATPLKAADFARGIKWFLEDSTRNEKVSQQASTSAQRRFDIGNVTEQYRNLYQTLM